jgi:adenine-specific DNA-methyltransferase
VGEYSHGLAGVAGPGTPNLIIEGDNYDSLRLLRSTHAGKVRVIYIDPPYNTGNKDWVYNDRYVGANDRWRHSQWLEFLYRRLVLAKDLLTQDGVIMVSINDENRARLELLMDEVFPGRRVGSMVWRTKDSTSRTETNFSEVHEHILIYAGPTFAFNGAEKSTKKYKNPDNDPRGPWNTDPLTVNADRFERPGFFYPLQNPRTGIWYPCDPDRIWAYASETRIKNLDRIRSGSMENWISQGKIIFPTEERVEQWDSLEALKRAISLGEIPCTPKRKKPLLTQDTPDLEFWVGKAIGFGRPGFKKHWAELNSHINPVSSWIPRASEDFDDEDAVHIRAPQAGEGTEAIQRLFGSKIFQYPKPPTLMEDLLKQASRPGDTVLDFFAGSGTTGHAVLALNALEPDAAPRKFILCSSTEATDKEPAKNLCRDVCAARIGKVIASDAALAHNSFAYLQLDKIAPGDAPFESDCAHAFQLLTLRLGKVARPMPAASQGMKILLQSVAEGSLTVLVHRLTPATLAALAALPLHPSSPGHGHLRVYSTRPDTVRQHLQQAWDGTDKVVESLSLQKALLHGQIAPRRKAAPKTTTESAAQ